VHDAAPSGLVCVIRVDTFPFLCALHERICSFLLRDRLGAFWALLKVSVPVFFDIDASFYETLDDEFFLRVGEAPLPLFCLLAHIVKQGAFFFPPRRRGFPGELVDRILFSGAIEPGLPKFPLFEIQALPFPSLCFPSYFLVYQQASSHVQALPRRALRSTSSPDLLRWRRLNEGEGFISFLPSRSFPKRDVAPSVSGSTTRATHSVFHRIFLHANAASFSAPWFWTPKARFF